MKEKSTKDCLHFKNCLSIKIGDTYLADQTSRLIVVFYQRMLIIIVMLYLGGNYVACYYYHVVMSRQRSRVSVPLALNFPYSEFICPLFQLGDQSDSFKIFQDEYLAEREQGYDNGRMESALVQSCLDHLQARQDDLRNSHAGLQASQADLQASHADLQGQVRRLQGERPQGPNGEGQ